MSTETGRPNHTTGKSPKSFYCATFGLLRRLRRLMGLRRIPSSSPPRNGPQPSLFVRALSSANTTSLVKASPAFTDGTGLHGRQHGASIAQHGGRRRIGVLLVRPKTECSWVARATPQCPNKALCLLLLVWLTSLGWDSWPAPKPPKAYSWDAAQRSASQEYALEDQVGLVKRDTCYWSDPPNQARLERTGLGSAVFSCRET